MARRATRRASGSRKRARRHGGARRCRPTRPFSPSVLRDDEFAHAAPTTDFLGRASRASSPRSRMPRRSRSRRRCSPRTRGYGEWNSWSNNPARTMRVQIRRAATSRSTIRATHSTPRSATPRRRCASSRSTRRTRASRSMARRRTVTFADRGRHDPPRARRRRATASTTPPMRAPARRAVGRADGRLVAPMNGRVVAVNAQGRRHGRGRHARSSCSKP